MQVTGPSDGLRDHEANMSADKRNKILIGCGIGLLVLGGVGAGVGIYLSKKSSGSSSGNNGSSSDAAAPAQPGADSNGLGYMAPASEVRTAALQQASAAAMVLGLQAALPQTVDWRTNLNVVTGVKNQGGCGSCWAFSAISTMESAYGIKYNSQVKLSPEQLVDCDTKDGGCNGGWYGTAWNSYYSTSGSPAGVEESNYPYAMLSPNGKQRNTCNSAAVANSGVVTVTGSTMVNSGTGWSQDAENKVMAYLATSGPASVAVWVASGFQSYRSGIATAATLGCSTGNTEGINHAIQLVGYGTENNQNYWIVRNQWGAGWGEGGYIRIARGANICCLLCDVMGVSVVAKNGAPTSAPTAKPTAAPTATPTTTKPTATPTTVGPPPTFKPTTSAATVKPTTSTPVTSKPTGTRPSSLTIRSLGCYKDASTRILPNKLTANPTTLSGCAWLAYNYKFTFFGLEVGGECWAGNAWDSSSTPTGPPKVVSNNCNMKCSDGTMCGGQWALTSYQILTPTDTQVSAFPVDTPPAQLGEDHICSFNSIGLPSFCWACGADGNSVICKDANQDPTNTAMVYPALCTTTQPPVEYVCSSA